MVKKTRTILFLIFLFLFLIASPLIVFYSQGYRLDLNPPAGGKKLTQTGGLFFKVLPKQAEIYLDGNLAKKTDFFFGSVLIENILPKNYKVEIKKEGYYPWEKTLEIKEKEVTESKNIILFPQEPGFSIFNKGVKNFWFSPDQKKIISQEENGKNWSLKLYELDKNIKSHLIEEKNISLKKVDLLNLEFSPDSKEISLEASLAEEIKHFNLKIDESPPLLTEATPLFSLPENTLTYQRFNNVIYYLDNSGNVFKSAPLPNEEQKTPVKISLDNSQRINAQPLTLQPETEYKLWVFPDCLFLQENKNLYQLNQESKLFEKFFDGLNGMKISPNLKKLVYFSDYEIWILLLKDDLPKKAGDKIFLTRFSEKITDCQWLTSDYLVFNTGDIIKISEIDKKDRINVIDIAKYKNPKLFWNQNNKELYILSEGNLYQSEKLIK